MRSRSGTRSPIVRIAFNPRKGKKLIPPHIERIACRIARLLGLQHVELSVLFTNNAGIRRLNRRYKGKRRATDVLAFSQWEGSHLVVPSLGGEGIKERVRQRLHPSPSPSAPRGEGRILLGDVVISWEQAERQAPLYRQSFAEELVLYLIHGVLHLLGYDDQTAKERLKMERLQKRILGQIRSEFPL